MNHKKKATGDLNRIQVSIHRGNLLFGTCKYNVFAVVGGDGVIRVSTKIDGFGNRFINGARCR
jgi:hypothetical protein